MIDIMETQLRAANWVRVSSSVSLDSPFILCETCRQLSDILTSMLFEEIRDEHTVDLVLDPTLCEFCAVISQIIVAYLSGQAPRSHKQVVCKVSHYDGYFLGDARVIPGLRCDLEDADMPLVWFFAAKGSTSIETNFLAEDNQGIRPVPSSVEYAQVQCWLDECKKEHGSVCNDVIEVEIPRFRLVDCVDHALVTLPASTPYTALSYVWGAPTDDEDAPTGSELPAKVPQVVEDAILVSKSLGYRYLWVDKYCIPQHDIDAKAEQILNMGVIYNNAEITIIAAAGHSAADGLPGVSSVTRTKVPLLTMSLDRTLPTVDGDIAPVITIQPQPSQWTRQEVLGSTWDTRGWTYQEGILSRRRLVFTPTQTCFQCQSCRQTSSEHGSFSISRVFDIGAVKYGEAIFAPLESDAIGFQRVVNEYASRNLTFETDRMNAFIGLLTELRKLEPALKSLYGIPLFSFEFKHSETPNTLRLILGLVFSWSHYRSSSTSVSTSERQGVLPLRRPGFPSWSWFGWCWPRDLIMQWIPAIVRPGWVHPESVRYHSHAHIELEFSDGDVEAWESDGDMALLFHSADDLKCLRITAPVIDLQLPPNIENSTDSTISCGGLLLNRGSVLRVLAMQRGEQEDDRPGDNRLCLVVLASHINLYNGSGIELFTLALRKLPEECAYERLEFLEIRVDIDTSHWGILSLAELDDDLREDLLPELSSERMITLY